MTELLERDRELVVIRAGLDAAAAGDGCCVLIEGPAGIGKSSLLAIARAEAGGRGFRVLHAAGGELERDFPYGVTRQLFSSTVTEEARAGRRLSGAAELARPVLALDPGHLGDTGGGDSRLLEALHGLYWLTVNLAADKPLLLAVDDAHWCDGASLQFLVYLRRRLEGLAGLVLVATRVGEPGADERLLRLLGGADNEAVRPSGLSATATADWLRRGLGEAPDPDFVAAAHAATEGNPFLLGELVTALVDAELRPTKQTAARVAAIGPAGVRRAVLRRLTALGEGASALARAVAVLGSGAELRDAAALADLTPAVATTLVESLVRVQVLRDERRLSFVHPLVRAAVYLDLPVAARAHLHARAARVLADEGADANAVAAHLLESDPAGDAAVVEQLRAGARRAVEQGAMDVAATYLRRAVAEPPSPAASAAVLRELGAAELAAGRPDAAAMALATAWAQSDDRRSGLSIVLMRRHALVLGDRIADAVAVVDEAAGKLANPPGSGDLLEAGALGAAHLDLQVVRGMEARLSALRRRAEAGEVGEPLALAVAALESAFANLPVAATTALTARTLAAMPHAHADSDYSVEGQLGLALLLSEQYDLLAEQAGAWIDDARRKGSLPRFISMATIRSNGAYRAGALADAEADGRDAFEAARLYGHHFWLPGAVAAVLNPLVEHGRLDEADAVLRDSQVEERHGRSHALCWPAMLLPARSRLRVAQGRLHEALADLRACGHDYESASNRSPSLWTWRSEAALVLAALGDRAEAGDLAAEELELARAFGGSRALGVALRAAGLVANGDEGVALLKEAAAVLAGSGAALERARVLVDLGTALRHRGRRTEARQPLRDGLDAAIRCGADVLAERARDELLATGAHLRRERLTGPDALTPSERRVAQLAAQGRSNPEIAQILFLTRRTIETHLTHAYQKLGISSREALSTALG